MQRDSVLIVDDDPEVRDLLMDQIFNPSQFEVLEARDGVEGLAMLEKHQPDLIYLDLVMPSLTGKDMLVAIKARHYHGPIIVGVKRGREPDAIEAFRFGATDYIAKPIREAEMMSVAKRAMVDVRLRKERKELMARLEHSNAELETRLRQLTTLTDLGKVLTAMRSLEEMFSAVLAGAIRVTGADYATLILHDPDSDQLFLRAGLNMTLVMQEKLGESIRDELARLVMTSQQPVVLEGDGLKRFRLSRDILATIYAPMSIHGTAIGVLTVGNTRKRSGFDSALGELVDSLADYAAVAIVNARLFATIEQRAKSLETAYAELKAHDQAVYNGLHGPLAEMEQSLQQLAQAGRLPGPAKKQLNQLSEQASQMHKLVAKFKPSQK